jgi:hypothetical protein
MTKKVSRIASHANFVPTWSDYGLYTRNTGNSGNQELCVIERSGYCRNSGPAALGGIPTKPANLLEGFTMAVSVGVRLNDSILDRIDETGPHRLMPMSIEWQIQTTLLPSISRVR